MTQANATAVTVQFMALLSKTEFARICGMESNGLAVYVRREQVNLTPDKMVDTNDPVNIRFLEHRQAKGKARKDLIGGLATAITVQKTEQDVKDDMDGIPEYQDSERRLKYFDAQKREREVSKLEIDIAKKRGELLPIELIPPVLKQHNQNILTSMRNEIEEFLRNTAKKYDISMEDLTALKAQSVSSLNHSIEKAIQNTVRSIDIIVHDYSEKRGVGERL